MDTSKGTNGYLFNRGYTNFMFILLFLLYMFDYIDRMVLSALGPYIQADWHINDTSFGALAAVLKISIVVLTFPISLLVDRWSRKRMIATMAVVWSLATAACAFTKNFSQLLLARLFIGAGEAGYAPGGTAMISALYPEKKRPIVIGIWNASIPIGSALGLMVGGWIAAHYGWKHAFGIVAIPGFIIALLFFLVKDYKTVDLTVVSKGVKVPEKSMRFRESAREFLGKPSLIYTYLGFAGVIYVTDSLLNWLPIYLNRFQDVAKSQAGLRAGFVLLLALIGAPLGGFIVDRWQRTFRRARLVFPAITTLISAGLMFAAFVIFSGKIQYYILLSLGIMVMAFVSGAAAVTQDVVHPGLRAVSYSLAVIIQNSAGSAGTFLTGWISTKTNLSLAMSILPISLVIAAVLFYAGSFYYVKDYNKVGNIEVLPE
jgi:MFS family permease